MSDLAKGWTSCQLQELLTSLESGSRPKGGVRGIADGVPSLGGEHLTYKGGFDFSSIKYVPKEFAERMNRGQILINDVLIVKDGATTGKTAFVGKDFPFENAVVNEHVFICRPTEFIEPRFLFRYLTSKEGQDRILENFQGSAQGGINLSFAPNTEIPLAPLNEQKRIVEKLEKLLGKVEAVQARLNKIPVILKRFRQAVLAAACSGKLTADWRKENTDESAEQLKRDIISEFYQKTKKKIDETEYFQKPDNSDIPSSWQWIISANIFYFVTSGSRGWASYYSNSGALFIRVGNLDHNSIQLDLTSKKFVNPPSNAEGTRTRVLENDVLVSITADVGMIALVNSDIGEAYINQHISLARPVEGIDKKFLAYYLTSEDGGQKQFRELQRGATKAGLGLGDIKNIWVALPPIEEQKEIVRRVEDLFKFADQIEARYKKARSYTDKLTQSILAKAFRGELVPQDENDESASVLLELIKAEKSNNADSIKGKQKRKPKTQKEDEQQTLFANG